MAYQAQLPCRCTWRRPRRLGQHPAFFSFSTTSCAGFALCHSSLAHPPDLNTYNATGTYLCYNLRAQLIIQTYQKPRIADLQAQLEKLQLDLESTRQGKLFYSLTVFSPPNNWPLHQPRTLPRLSSRQQTRPSQTRATPSRPRQRRPLQQPQPISLQRRRTAKINPPLFQDPRDTMVVVSRSEMLWVSSMTTTRPFRSVVI